MSEPTLQERLREDATKLRQYADTMQVDLKSHLLIEQAADRIDELEAVVQAVGNPDLTTTQGVAKYHKALDAAAEETK